MNIGNNYIEAWVRLYYDPQDTLSDSDVAAFVEGLWECGVRGAYRGDLTDFKGERFVHPELTIILYRAYSMTEAFQKGGQG